MAVEPTDLALVQAALEPFLKKNPTAKIVAAKNVEQSAATIENAWDDESIQINVPKDYAAFATELNGLFLPERFAALYHVDAKRLEFIWTALPLPTLWGDIPGRSFTFRFKGKDHNCSFAASSAQLLTIGKHFGTGASSSTSFRNLLPYSFYSQREALKAAGAALIPDSAALSFWVDGIEWEDDSVLDLVNHLNFYLKYYDTISPTVLVYYPKESESLKPQTRFSFGTFPPHIEGREIDDVLLILWDASRSGDNARRFLYCYRIIEYASFGYVEAKARMDVKRILSVPHALSDIGATTSDVIEALQRAKPDDFARVESLLKEVLKPALIWREIVENKAAFTTVTKFDGGYDLAPLMAPEMTQATFEVRGMENFNRAIRDIRNALSHGKDSRMAGVITPTTTNFERLRPWVSVASVAAAEVMLYKNLL